MITKVEIIFYCSVVIVQYGFTSCSTTLSTINSTACDNGTYLKHGMMLRDEDIIHAKGCHTGTVIFLHGVGSTGARMKKAVINANPDFQFEHVKIIFPTASLIPYTPEKNQPRHAWFDKMGNVSYSPERIDTLKRTVEDLKEVIRTEQKAGIAHDRIVIGGFSMGGAMAMYMGYHVIPTLNGVFALSAYLHSNSSLYDELDKRIEEKMPSLFYAHGNKDTIVPHQHGNDTFQRLSGYGIQGVFQTEEKLPHRVRKDEIEDLWKWIAERLPNNSNKN